ncbi:MAG: class I SAM-dependent methyltransferase [Pseudomonadales bacterium]|jgi:trans-aconitate methyltransferase|nr:class I SAM-dependent methyltransferase [Pseudomonadales bacterium]
MTPFIVKQFRHPEGFAGRIAGWIMAHRRSNLRRNLWTAELLELKFSDSVLEIGPGPGETLHHILTKVTHGQVSAIDYSELMLEASRRRNKTALAQGRLKLIAADISRLTTLPERYDKIFAVNSLQFNGLNHHTLHLLCNHLKPSGTLAITYQPRGAKVSTDKAQDTAAELKAMLHDIGLENIATHTLALKSSPAICVVGKWQ